MVIITYWLTATKYPYILNGNECFPVYKDVFCPLSPSRLFIGLIISNTAGVLLKKELFTLQEQLGSPLHEQLGSNPAARERVNPAAREGENPAAHEGVNPAAREGMNPAAREGVNPAVREEPETCPILGCK
jgi:hypothetical protein